MHSGQRTGRQLLMRLWSSQQTRKHLPQAMSGFLLKSRLPLRVCVPQADADTIASLTKAIEDRKTVATAPSDNSGGGGSSSVPGLPPGVHVEDAMVLTMPGTKDGATKVTEKCLNTTFFRINCPFATLWCASWLHMALCQQSTTNC